MRVHRLALVGVCGFVMAAITVGAGPTVSQAVPPGWTVTDLGTLGGNTSFAEAINASGQIVGRSATSGGTTHAFLWSATNGMIDLAPSSTRPMGATEINDTGQVAGDEIMPDGTTRGFVWSAASGMMPVAGGPMFVSHVTDMNSSGQITGTGTRSDHLQHAFIWQTGMIDLGTLGGTQSSGVAINDAGAVAGTSFTSAGVEHAFIKTASAAMSDLGTLGGITSYAADINGTAQVTGMSRTADGSMHAFVWAAGAGMVDLGTLGGADSEATAINDAGEVTGFSDTTAGTSHAFVWSPATGMIDLGSSGQPRGINGVTEIAGYRLPADGLDIPTAFSWSPEAGMVGLDTLGGDRGLALAINANGLIAGWSTIADGNLPRAVVWTPTGRSAPAAPSNVTIVGPNALVTVSWADNSSNESGFELQRARWNGTSWTEWVGFSAGRDVTTYVDNTAVTGQYAYLVRARNGSGTSAWAIAVFVHSGAIAPPSAPTGLTAASSGADVHLQWTDPNWSELGQDVMRARWVAGDWSEWASWPADIDATTFTDASVPDGFYAYLVRAHNPIGVSAWVITTLEHTTASAPPAAPSNLTVSSAGRDIELAWVDNSTTEIVFDVERARYNASDGAWQEWTSWPSDRDITTFIDDEVPDAQYAYLVRARNPLGASDWAIATIEHTTATTAPAAPTELGFTGGGTNVDVTWADNASDEFGYDIQRASWNGTVWTEWTSWPADANTMSFSDTVDHAGRYAYLVRAYNPNGSSAWLIGEFEVVW